MPHNAHVRRRVAAHKEMEFFKNLLLESDSEEDDDEEATAKGTGGEGEGRRKKKSQSHGKDGAAEAPEGEGESSEEEEGDMGAAIWGALKLDRVTELAKEGINTIKNDLREFKDSVKSDATVVRTFALSRPAPPAPCEKS